MDLTLNINLDLLHPGSKFAGLAAEYKGYKLGCVTGKPLPT